MAAKTKRRTRRDIYREALGQELSCFRVLAFQFRDEASQHAAHYDLMMSGLKYALYDGYRTQAYIIIDPEFEAQIRAFFTPLGQEIQPCLDL